MGYRFSGQRTFKSLQRIFERKVFRKVLTPVISFLLVATTVFAATTTSGSRPVHKIDPDCFSAEIRKTFGLDDGVPTDLAAFLSGTPILKDGVIPWSQLAIRNQYYLGYCWSYALNEFVDGYAKQMANNDVVTSADHNGFWHLYSEFFNHKEYFDQLKKKVLSKKISKQKAIEEVNLMLRLRKGSETRKNFGYVMDRQEPEKVSNSTSKLMIEGASKSPPEVNMGSNESTALMEAPQFGFVADAVFDHAIKTEKQGNNFQVVLNKLIGQFLSQDSKLSTYTTKAADGVNDDLYQLMVKNLGKFYGGSTAHPPYRPGDTFTVGTGKNAKTYTPISYMKEVLNFDPTDYVEVTMTEKNQDAWLAAVNHLLTLNGATGPKAIPIGIPIFNQALAERQGVFSLSTLQAQPVGGHEIMIENELADSNGDPNSAVSQNSWAANNGLTIDGKKPKTKTQGGYYGITYPYLIAVMKLGEPPSIMIPKALLELPEFAALKHAQ